MDPAVTEQMIEIADGNADEIFYILTLEFREQGTQFAVIIFGFMQQLANLMTRPVLQFCTAGNKAAGTLKSPILADFGGGRVIFGFAACKTPGRELFYMDHNSARFFMGDF